MERWEQAADVQLELVQYFSTPRGKRDANGFWQIHTGHEKIGLEAIDQTMTIVQGAQKLDIDFADQIWLTLKVADPIYVSDEMVDLWEAAAEGFQMEALLPSDLITEAGFIFFPRPVYTTDAHGKQVAHRAVSWYPLKVEVSDKTPDQFYEGVMFTFYSNVHDDDDYVAEWREQYEQDPSSGQWAISHSAPVRFYDPPGSMVELLPDERASIESYWRPLLSLLRLMQQYISTREKYQPSRPVRRRMQREDMRQTDVTVIRLRRPRSKQTHEGEHIEYSHRFIVNGHWRNQWFPSLNHHRQIYISDYVKGPEDKPLRIKDRVFEFVR